MLKLSATTVVIIMLACEGTLYLCEDTGFLDGVPFQPVDDDSASIFIFNMLLSSSNRLPGWKKHKQNLVKVNLVS